MANPLIIKGLTSIFGGLISAIDEWHTSDEEKLIAKGQIFAAQGELLTRVFDYESKVLQMQADVIIAEAKGDSWLQQSWRPITMLVFVALVVARWLGFTADTITPELEKELMLLIQIGLGGYVVGRSAEKVAKSINFNKAADTE